MSYKRALIEALSTPDAKEVVFDTIELIHPLFVDDAGKQMAVRLVLGQDDIFGRLENTAVLNPGQIVQFYAADFGMTMGDLAEGVVPSLQLKIANLDREITMHIEQAAQSYDPMVLYYRPYLSGNESIGSEMDVPYMFQLANVTVDVFVVSGTATLDDVHNFAFPNKRYVPEVFKGLVR